MFSEGVSLEGIVNIIREIVPTWNAKWPVIAGSTIPSG